MTQNAALATAQPTAPAVWTADAVAQRIAEAADTLMALPMPKSGFPAGYITAWPGVVHSLEEVFAARTDGAMRQEIERALNSRNRPARAAPSRQRIGEMDEALGWLLWLNITERKVVFARACRLSWPRVAETVGACRASVALWHGRALGRIVKALNAER